MATTTTIEGRITGANGTRFQLEGHPDWVHISKWPEPGTAVPPVGTLVEVGLDAKGFARTITAKEQPKAAPAAQPAQQQEAPRGALPSRETAITRMACLNTATNILSSGGQSCEAKDVVTLAAELEQWVNR